MGEAIRRGEGRGVDGHMLLVFVMQILGGGVTVSEASPHCGESSWSSLIVHFFPSRPTCFIPSSGKMGERCTYIPA